MAYYIYLLTKVMFFLLKNKHGMIHGKGQDGPAQYLKTIKDKKKLQAGLRLEEFGINYIVICIYIQ